METVKLNDKDWMDVCYALRSKGNQLKEIGLEEEAKNMERIRTLIKEQLM